MEREYQLGRMETQRLTPTLLLLCFLYFEIMGKTHTRRFSALSYNLEYFIWRYLYFTIVGTVLEMTELYLIGLMQSCKHNDEVLYFRQ